MKHHLFLFISVGALVFSSAQAAESRVQWSYEGESGPEHWGELSEEYSRCMDGKNQSPVDLVADFDVNLPELVFEYRGSPLRETNNGHTIVVYPAPGNFLSIPEKELKFEFQQGHFHSPSEHTVNGEHYPMEIHLVHTNDEGQLVVVGVMVEEGEENEMLNKIWSFMPEQAGETRESPISVFEAGVLPPTRDYFSYDGSLTTPPCSEGVSWIVLREPFTASIEQVERFKQRVGQATNRPVQKKYARTILD